MTIEFRLGRTDHLVVEDFLAGDTSAGVGAIVVEAPLIGRQRVAIEAAEVAGLDVLIETLTDRLAEPGYDTSGFEYATSYPLRPVDYSSLLGRARLVEAVLHPQLATASILTPPHFFADTAELLDLNIALAGLTRQEYGSSKRVRPVVAARRALLAEPGLAKETATKYRTAGLEQVELRLSPLGGENDGAQKIRSAFEIVEAFRGEGLGVSLGWQSNIGHTAVALGLADSFSVGIGYRERYDHASQVSAQRRLFGMKREEKQGPRGPLAGVHFTDAAVTVQRKLAMPLLQNPAIRSRLACTIGECRNSIEGPARDPRRHYLHSQAAIAASGGGRPPAWRANLERQRLEKAVEIRDILNEHYLSSENRLRSRTLEALVSEISRRTRQGHSLSEGGSA